MSSLNNRKPLLRFETGEKAKLISTSSMPAGGKRKRRSVNKSKSTSSGSKKVRVIKGKVNLKVPGYLGLQKVAPSSLIPYLPANKLRQAAKKALSASGARTVGRKRKRTKRK